MYFYFSAMAVWGFAFPGCEDFLPYLGLRWLMLEKLLSVAANTARDLGGRLASMTIYGMKGQ